MSDFIDRLFEERVQLSQRIENLQNFIVGDVFNSLPQIEKNALAEQFKHMQCYFDVLDKRLTRLCNKA